MLANRALEAALARIVVQTPGPIPAADVYTRLPYDWRETVEVGDVMTALRSEPAFRLIRGRGWELGHPPEQRRRPVTGGPLRALARGSAEGPPSSD